MMRILTLLLICMTIAQAEKPFVARPAVRVAINKGVYVTSSNLNIVDVGKAKHIYLKRGSTYSGTLNISSPDVIVEAYGSGAKPIILGGSPLTGWTVHSGAIYKAKASGIVKNLFSNGVQMTLARYPNTGFVRIGSTNSNTTITSPTINLGFDWTGGNARVRTQAYEYETHVISSHNDTTLVLGGTSGYSDPYKLGFGFYLDNKLAALDTVGEWYCGTDSVVYFNAGVDPSTLTVIGSTSDYGINGSKGGITVKNLAFKYQALAAIHFTGGSNIRVLSNDIYAQAVNGIDFVGTHTNCTIDGNTIQNVNGRGINCQSSPQYFTITNNTIKSIGLVPGYGISAWQGMTAILSQGGTGNLIGNNIIDSVGYCGIRTDGTYSTVQYNVISNSMLKLTDGGAIYSYGQNGLTYGHTWRNNIITNVTGGGQDSYSSSYIGSVFGLYLDYNSHDMTITGNTVSNAYTAGVFSQFQDYNNTITGNTLYANNNSIYFTTDSTFQYGGNVVKNNVVYVKQAQGGYPFYLVDVSPTYHSLGTLDSNYYYKQGTSTPISRAYKPASEIVFDYLTLAEWRTWSGQEAHSIVFPTAMNGYIDTLIVNATASPVTSSLDTAVYYDIDAVQRASVTVPAFSSKLFLKKIMYSIIASAGANGTISPSGTTTLLSGSTQEYTITADGGYAIDTVYVDGAANATAKATGSYTFSSLAANHTISCVFAANSTIIADDFESGSFNAGWTAILNDTIGTAAQWGITAPPSGTKICKATNGIKYTLSGAAQSEVWIKMSAYSTAADGGDMFTYVQASNQSDIFIAYLRNDYGGLRWNWWVPSVTSATVTTTSQNTWHVIKYHLKIGSSDGIIQIWIDGTLKTDLQNRDNGTTPMTYVWFGNNGGSSNARWIDNIGIYSADPDL